MRIKVLGSAAGGGFPQWNCNCRNCAGARSGNIRARPRTQSSIALSVDGARWVLCNASPDIHAQIRATAEQQEPGSMIDLPVRQHDCGDTGSAQRIRALQLRGRANLRVDVR